MAENTTLIGAMAVIFLLFSMRDLFSPIAEKKPSDTTPSVPLSPDPLSPTIRSHVPTVRVLYCHS